MRIRKVNSQVVFDLTIDDLSSMPQMLVALERQVKDESAQRVVANLEGITSIYSMQIGTLVAMHVKCYENLAVMTLANVHPHVRDQLQMVGLDKLMEMHHGSEATRESFGESRHAH